MSFEGYYQVICQNGHYDEIDWLSLENCREGNLCDECRAGFIWRNRISTTNGSDDDYGQRVEFQPDSENNVSLPPACVFCGSYSFKHGEYEGLPCCKECGPEK